MIVQIDINDLAAEITRKIRDEINAQKIINFGVINAFEAKGAGYRARLIIDGSNTPSVWIDCITSYTPKAGDRVIMAYPKNSSPVIIGKCP